MIEKLRIPKKQAIEIRGKMDRYIEEFEEKHLYENLYKYLEIELKNTYHLNGIGRENIKDISRKCICKKKDWNNFWRGIIRFLLCINCYWSSLDAVCFSYCCFGN